jgi:hypothetical protein
MWTKNSRIKGSNMLWHLCTFVWEWRPLHITCWHKDLLKFLSVNELLVNHIYLVIRLTRICIHMSIKLQQIGVNLDFECCSKMMMAKVLRMQKNNKTHFLICNTFIGKAFRRILKNSRCLNNNNIRCCWTLSTSLFSNHCVTIFI